MTRLPEPGVTPLLGHLWRWTRDPVRLLIDGARTGPVFRLRLWRPVVVGYRPDWNRAILGDLETFRSAGSLSGLTPYLAGGVVHSDVPEHDLRRRELNPHFHSRGVEPLRASLRISAATVVPEGRVDALAWAGLAVRRMLNAAFFDGRMPDRLLEGFLAPLGRKNPAPLLPRPVVFRRVEAEIGRILRAPPAGTLAAALAGLDGAMEEIRVALAAGYDTTTHTLAWALWHLAGAPEWRRCEALGLVVDEVLRLYPAGWLGSRVASRNCKIGGVEVPAGTMVFYSPLLTHRDPQLWPDPCAFRPDRFEHGRPAWAFIPFSAGRRTCLGASLANEMLQAALEPFFSGTLARLGGNATIEAGITLRPRGPLWISRTGPS